MLGYLVFINNYFVDLNVDTTTNTYLFESHNLENASQFILKLNAQLKKNVTLGCELLHG